MNEAQQRLLRERLLNLSRRIAMVAGNNNPDTHLSWSDEILAIVKDVDLAVLEQPQGEPRAWLYTSQDGHTFPSLVRPKAMDAYYTHEPLYTHASPTPPPDDGLIKRANDLIPRLNSGIFMTGNDDEWEFLEQAAVTVRDLRDAYVKSMGRVK